MRKTFGFSFFLAVLPGVDGDADAVLLPRVRLAGRALHKGGAATHRRAQERFLPSVQTPKRHRGVYFPLRERSRTPEFQAFFNAYLRGQQETPIGGQMNSFSTMCKQEIAPGSQDLILSPNHNFW